MNTDTQNKEKLNSHNEDNRSQRVLVVPLGAINPKTGGGQRTRLLFDALKKSGDVTVVALGEKPGNSSGLAEFYPGCKQVLCLGAVGIGKAHKNSFIRALKGGLRVLCPTLSYKIDRELNIKLIEILKGLNTECVAFRYTRTFAITGLQINKPENIRIFLDIDDRDDFKAKAQLQHKLSNKGLNFLIKIIISNLQKHIFKIWSKADVVWLAKSQDFMTKDQIKVHQSLIPNVPHSSPDSSNIISAEKTDPVVLFVGSAGHNMNVDGVRWFLENCWQAVVKANPLARFRVVGFGDWSSKLKDYSNTQGIEVIGSVESVYDEYKIARFAISPILVGAGSQIKVIEACAHSRIVVATELSASGFGEKIESLINPCVSAEAFIDMCLTYLDDAKLADRRGKEARSLQEQLFSRDAVLKTITKDITDIISSR
jgi:glycosyltransferase involved in cell wall biosynthesis